MEMCGGLGKGEEATVPTEEADEEVRPDDVTPVLHDEFEDGPTETAQSDVPTVVRVVCSGDFRFVYSPDQEGMSPPRVIPQTPPASPHTPPTEEAPPTPTSPHVNPYVDQTGDEEWFSAMQEAEPSAHAEPSPHEEAAPEEAVEREEEPQDEEEEEVGTTASLIAAGVDWDAPETVELEKYFALTYGKKFKERGPPPPSDGGPQTWRGQRWRGTAEDGRWGNRGRNSAGAQAYYDRQKKSTGKGTGKGQGKGGSGKSKAGDAGSSWSCAASSSGAASSSQGWSYASSSWGTGWQSSASAAPPPPPPLELRPKAAPVKPWRDAKAEGMYDASQRY